MDSAEPAAEPRGEGASRLLQRAAAVFVSLEARAEYRRSGHRWRQSTLGAALLPGVLAAVSSVQRGDQHDGSQ